jgi:hypothetical protein
MPRKLTIGKTSKISIFQRKTGRWIVSWYDQHGTRRNPSFATLKEAESFQKQKRAELERHREGRFNLDDREMLSQARDLASTHGYTVLQAIQEWHSSKGASKAMPLGEVIDKFLAAKSNRSAAYMDKLNTDMRLFLSHFGGDRSIDRIGSDEIEDFLDSKKAASRRRNNLRSEIITLFKYAQIRLRALHRDRKTEAELVYLTCPHMGLRMRLGIGWRRCSWISIIIQSKALNGGRIPGSGQSGCSPRIRTLKRLSTTTLGKSTWPRPARWYKRHR